MATCWFPEDVRNQLLAARQPLLQAGIDGEFRRGYEAALITLALAFGLELSTIGLTPHPGLTVRVFNADERHHLGGDPAPTRFSVREEAPPGGAL